jgi:hypothetical protein
MSNDTTENDKDEMEVGIDVELSERELLSIGKVVALWGSVLCSWRRANCPVRQPPRTSGGSPRAIYFARAQFLGRSAFSVPPSAIYTFLDTREALLNPMCLASEGQQRMLQCPPKEPRKRKADIPMGSKDCWAELRRCEAEHPCWKRMPELLFPEQAER